MIHTVNGNVFDTDADIIAHGCNCRGAFGAGFARAVSVNYPRARNYYLDKFDEEGWKLGDIQPVLQWDGKYVVNCATQDSYFPHGIQHANYDAIRLAMTRLKEFAKDKGFKIAIPKIGAGLAGGDWEVISKILEEVYSDYDITIYHL